MIEVVFVYGLFIGFLIWIAVGLYRGNGSRAGKLYSFCAFIAALVAVSRYLGRQLAGYPNSLNASTLIVLWFVLWGVVAAIFAFRASRFQQSVGRT